MTHIIKNGYYDNNPCYETTMTMAGRGVSDAPQGEFWDKVFDNMWERICGIYNKFINGSALSKMESHLKTAEKALIEMDEKLKELEIAGAELQDTLYEFPQAQCDFEDGKISQDKYDEEFYRLFHATDEVSSLIQQIDLLNSKIETADHALKSLRETTPSTEVDQKYAALQDKLTQTASNISTCKLETVEAQSKEGHTMVFRELRKRLEGQSVTTRLVHAFQVIKTKLKS